MKIVSVIPMKKGIITNELDYFTTKNVLEGDIVSVTLRNKEVLGLVLSVENVFTTKLNIKDMDFNLKKIIEVKKDSIFRKEYIDSILLTAKYFAGSKSNAFVSLIPSSLREDYDHISELTWSSEAQTVSLDPNLVNIRPEKLLLQEPILDRISIYKTLIRENFALKKSVFIVLPTEMDIKVFEEYLSKGIQEFTFSLYGRLSNKKIIEKFEKIVSTPHPVLIIATPPFLSISRLDLGVIILEHESSSSYRMISKPHFDLRIFVELFASKINAKFILGDTMLSFETIARQEIDFLTPMHPLSFRTNFTGKIQVENPNKKKETPTNAELATKHSFEILSSQSILDIQDTLAKKKNVFIFSLRKGLATQTLCRDCGEIVSCEKCSSPLVLYDLESNSKENSRSFICNKCGEEKNTEIKCTNCDSWNLIPLGVGTDTVYAYISKLFPKIKILKLDKDSAKSKKDVEKILKEFDDNPGSILIGSQMVLLYLENRVSLSIIASFDSFWSIPNFRMSEKIIQLVTSIMEKTEDKFIINTKNESDSTVQAIVNGNLLSLVRDELEDRKKLSYPPFKRFIKIRFLGSPEETFKTKEHMLELFKNYKPLIFDGFVSQVKNKHVTNILLKIERKEWSLPELSIGSSIDELILEKLSSLPPNFEIFVDPEDLL
ncbi:MAG: hypothetical protein AAB510_00695 [Patescibacteria group bacterium]